MFPSLSPLALAIFVISVASTKLLHIVLNSGNIPISVFIFCLPAVFFVDVLEICIVWILLRRKNASWLSFFGAVGGFVICIITLAAASSQWGFFYQTGGQVRWADAKAYANKDTIHVLLSESKSALGFGSAIISVAWITRTWIYRVVGAFVTTGETQASKAVKLLDASYGGYFSRSSVKIAARKEGSIDSLLSLEDGLSSESDLEEDDPQAEGDLPQSLKFEGAVRWGPFVWWLLITVGTLSLLGIIIAFDPDWPYAEMMTTLPLPLLSIFAPKPIECTWTRSTWPLPELISRSNWEQPRGDFKGWAPGSDNEMVRNYRDRIPPWLPNPAPPGFVRWDEQEKLKAFHIDSADENTVLSNELLIEDDTQCPDIEEEPFYSPVNDPLRITNLNLDILSPLREALNSVKIKHIAFIKLESTREELFPLQQDSDIYKFIMNSHHEEDHPKINQLLSQLTPNAEKITGKPGNFRRSDGKPYEKPQEEEEWKDPTPAGFGGINVVGALTPSSVSTKSLAASHCGVWPLAVDTFEEGDLQSYQPCIPQILNMFNQLKPKTSQNSTDGFRNLPWNPAFFASIIDDYDRQHEFEENIGFKYFINRDKIAAEEERNNTGLEVINYFGYPENALTQYVKDYIAKITENNERMFLSHFTSTTHHPWGLPNWFQKVDYMGDANGMRSHEYFNDYLNTVRFVDGWLGQLMGILEETGIANETLVVFVGDHGQAFKEDFKKTGTYDNSHISNYRVPLTLRHPHLPRIQYEANATSLSILPTILDLLIHTNSLDAKDTEAASDLIHDYEGQSLIRPYQRTHHGRRAWNFGIVNPGGHLLTVTSADVPWRLSMPIDSEKAEFVFTDLSNDPLEVKRLSKWSVHGLIHALRRTNGEEAAKWVEEAEVLARWWVKSRKRLWRYRPK